MYKTIHRSFITPLSDLITGWNIKHSLSFLEKSQYWSKDEIYNFQLSRLRRMLKFAYDNTEFYHKRFKDYDFNPEAVKEIKDLRKLPVLSKTDIQKNLPDKIVANDIIRSKKYIMSATSGSTGAQMIYPISKAAYGFVNATAMRGWSWMGFQLGDKYIKVSQNRRKSTIKRLQDIINRSLLFTAPYDEGGFKEFVQKMQMFKPDFLRSYPDPLIFISKYIINNEITVPKVKAINTTGNTLFNEDRLLIEKAFNARIFDSYSCEGGAQVFECQTHDVYHIADEYAITEILDENGNEVCNGEKGRLITTDLWNFATPFIRYETKDIVIKGKNKCTCSRNLNTISSITGRENDIIITPDNQYLIGQNFTTSFKYYPGILQFQVQQSTLEELIFRFVVNHQYTQDQEAEIIKYWQKKTNSKMKILIQIVDKIPARPSGKIQFVVRNPDIQLK